MTLGIWLYQSGRLAILPGAFLVMLGLLSVFARQPQAGRGSSAIDGGRAKNAVFTFSACVSVALALGLACAVAYQAFQSRMGLGPRLILPDGLLRVSMLGLGGGLLLGLALLRLRFVPQGIVLGAALGMLLGLVAFRLIFGRTAGYGDVIGEGAGFEVALPFALGGGLGGALVGMLMRAPSGMRNVKLIVLGAISGAGVGVVVAFTGWWFQLIDLRLPYIAQVPSVQAVESQAQTALGVLYGLGIFGVLAGLMGALTGAYVAQAKADGTGSSWRMWLAGGSLFTTFAVCLWVGLQIGFEDLYLGGPIFTTMAANRPLPTSNPVASTMALAAGGVLALVVCVAMWFVLRKRQQRMEVQRWASGAWLALCSLTLLLLPFWFIPAFWIDIY